MPRTIERLRTLDELIEAMHDDQQVADAIELYTKQMITDYGSVSSGVELLAKIESRYNYYLETPLLIEDESASQESA